MSDGFLSRWARRKEAVRTAERTGPPAGPAEAAGPEALPAPGQATGESVLPLQAGAETASTPELDELLARLPSLDALTAESGLSDFLQTGVPTALRNAALRRMWSLDPAIRDFVSEAREYAYDWNMPGGVPGMGPLLPTDDVAAMLRRIVEGVPPKVEEESLTEGEAPNAPPPDRPAEAGATAALEADPLPANGEATQPPPAPLLASSLAPSPIPSHAPAQATVEARPQAVQTAPMTPRLRRHGGAMPS
ncbi:MAG TPA: DUF3306 domain-containing protein [Methylorubrum populi]|uniref:DUF3306 domain-containing protein n=1 Tax=Methylorubrum populi TaxID=223967 RepID=A0A921E3M2_9HYPH|nr:DUF3306 domain-containing protein [Methylorubrum populi]